MKPSRSLTTSVLWLCTPLSVPEGVFPCQSVFYLTRITPFTIIVITNKGRSITFRFLRITATTTYMMSSSIGPYVPPGTAPSNRHSVNICIIYFGATTTSTKSICSVEPVSSSTSTSVCVATSPGKVREEQPTSTVLPHALLFNALLVTS